LKQKILQKILMPSEAAKRRAQKKKEAAKSRQRPAKKNAAEETDKNENGEQGKLMKTKSYLLIFIRCRKVVT